MVSKKLQRHTLATDACKRNGLNNDLPAKLSKEWLLEISFLKNVAKSKKI